MGEVTTMLRDAMDGMGIEYAEGYAVGDRRVNEDDTTQVGGRAIEEQGGGTFAVFDVPACVLVRMLPAMCGKTAMGRRDGKGYHVKYYALQEGEAWPDAFCAVDDHSGEPDEFRDYVPAGENARLRGLVGRMWPAYIGRERCNFADRVRTRAEIDELGIEVPE